MTRVCLVTFGSMGDVHPMLALGMALRARGHDAVLLTNPVFAQAAAKAGIGFHAVGRVEDQEATVRHPKLWHPIDGLGVMWRYMLRPVLEPTYDALAELSKQERCVVIANPVAMGARVAQEHLGVPLISVYTAATMLRSRHAPMTLASWRVPAWMPKAALGAAWSLLDRLKLEPLVRPALDALRTRLALPPIEGSVFGQWMHSPQAGIALFPAWFAKAAPDWPPQVRQAGFALYDETADLPPALDAFLGTGPAPVVFMPGTAQHDAADFFSAAVRACAHTGQRGVLLGQVDDALLRSLPAGMHAERYAPFGTLLPRTRALVHHGGIGSCAQALRAGLPQLVAPKGYDQFDNAMRLEQLGVGTALTSFDALPSQLSDLLANASVASACARHAPQVSSAAAIEIAARLVETLA